MEKSVSINPSADAFFSECRSLLNEYKDEIGPQNFTDLDHGKDNTRMLIGVFFATVIIFVTIAVCTTFYVSNNISERKERDRLANTWIEDPIEPELVDLKGTSLAIHLED